MPTSRRRTSVPPLRTRRVTQGNNRAKRLCLCATVERSVILSMHPAAVFVVLFSICICTTTIYFARVPDNLSKGLANMSKVGYWGPPNAEFDWCEYNHLSSFYIAEPVNSYSMLSFAFVIHAILSSTSPILHTCTHAPWILLEVAVIAAGSFAFHSTLQYSMQLADELPMLALVIHASYVLYCRSTAHSSKRPRPFLFRALCALIAVTSCALVFSPRLHPLHFFFRGCLSYVFAVGFIYVFVAQSAAASDIDSRFSSSENFGGKSTFSAIFSKGFCSFLVALFGWIIENVACAQLQNLPFGLPFPHFHGILWHLGCAAGPHSSIHHLHTHFSARLAFWRPMFYCARSVSVDMFTNPLKLLF